VRIAPRTYNRFRNFNPAQARGRAVEDCSACKNLTRVCQHRKPLRTSPVERTEDEAMSLDYQCRADKSFVCPICWTCAGPSATQNVFGRVVGLRSLFRSLKSLLFESWIMVYKEEFDSLFGKGTLHVNDRVFHNRLAAHLIDGDHFAFTEPLLDQRLTSQTPAPIDDHSV
jgi:hypothetical protein